MISGIEKRKKCCILLYNRYFGRLAQLVRASRLHRECRRFESVIAHQSSSRRSRDFASASQLRSKWIDERTRSGRLPRRNLQSRWSRAIRHSITANLHLKDSQTCHPFITFTFSLMKQLERISTLAVPRIWNPVWKNTTKAMYRIHQNTNRGVSKMRLRLKTKKMLTLLKPT